MNFYQQKYFQPYRKIRREPIKSPEQQSRERASTRQPSYRQSPNREDSPNRGPTFERSPYKPTTHSRLTTEPVWEHLYKQGRKSRRQLLEKHNDNKTKIDLECTFQPILKHNKRYMVHSNSNFFDRINNWNQQKIEKKVKEKQEQVCNDLKECTFTPKTNTKTRKATQNLNKSLLRTDKSQSQLRQRNRNLNPYYSPLRDTRKKASPNPSPLRYKQQKPAIEMPSALKMIKSELRRINL